MIEQHFTHMGFEIGTGEPILVPRVHTTVTGQTQRSGKTTLLEALIGRAKVPAITFITKRGESGFSTARRIAPYFKDQGDWEFTASILEASRGEKLKYERSSIINASKGASTLAEVHRNVRDMLKLKRVFDLKALTCLNAYLDKVVPQIDQIAWAPSVAIGPGVNAMDLTLLNVEMQHLVIKSTIDWVLNKEEQTVVVVPEAWKFAPQGRGTPVKLAAEEYVRQGAGLGNFLWLDSQDIAGVDKIILKQFPLWILGVQREANEIERTLDQIPQNVNKPKPEAIAKLKLGHFFACWDEHLHHVYAQPIWMSNEDARRVARGEADARDFAAPIADRAAAPAPVVISTRRPDKKETPPTAPPAPPQPSNESEEEMSPQQMLELKECFAVGFQELGKQINKLAKPAVLTNNNAPATAATPVATPLLADEESLFQRFKERLMEESPALIKLLIEKPEINVEVERPTLTMDKSSYKGRIAILIANNFFKNPVKNPDIKRELERTGGSEIHGGNLTRDLAAIVKLGFLTDEAEGYKEVPGMKVNIVKK